MPYVGRTRRETAHFLAWLIRCEISLKYPGTLGLRYLTESRRQHHIAGGRAVWGVPTDPKFLVRRTWGRLSGSGFDVGLVLVWFLGWFEMELEAWGFIRLGSHANSVCFWAELAELCFDDF